MLVLGNILLRVSSLGTFIFQNVWSLLTKWRAHGLLMREMRKQQIITVYENKKNTTVQKTLDI